MWYIAVIIVLTFGFAFTNKISAQTKKNSKNEIQSKEKLEIVNDTIKPLYSKKQIEDKLNYLAKTPPPTDLSFGAMCYSVIITAFGQSTYICPICGERTIYNVNFLNKNKDWLNAIAMELESYRREVEKINGINIRLDESQLCGHCSPKVEKPEFSLLINVGGESDTTTLRKITDSDIRKIKEFLDGKLIYRTENDFEFPLVNDIEWLKQLFKVETKKIDNE